MSRSPQGPFTIVFVLLAFGFVATFLLAGSRTSVDPRVLFWGVGLLAIGSVIWQAVIARGNARDLQAFARLHGWTYMSRSNAPAGRYHVRPFGVGHSQSYRSVASGEFAGAQCTTFTYRFETGSGKERTTHVYTIDTVGLQGWLPRLELSPEGVGSKLAKAFGGQDLEMESAAFNARWRVKASDQRFAYAVLHPRMLEHLLTQQATGMGLNIDGSAVVGWRVGSHGPADLAERFSLLVGFARRIPEHVWREFHGDPNGAPS